ncbi:helix-turn-helix transcriptional regulator [Micromonospora rhizosphaerae]|uniref:helix-turn-helix transcriptional regulator n=1 Tax=Micromonospora rhizosphaerae TaxID=568872 RepID=UPI00159F1FA2|nr:AraC family transcriptional regulator [Micromonospora rhizosphaerae]
MYEQMLDAGFELHWHEFFELSFVTAGAGLHTLNGTMQRVRAGDILALTPADFHEIRPHPGTRLHITNVVYSDEQLPPELRPDSPSEPAIHLPDLAPDFQRMLAESRRPDPVSMVALHATLARVLADVARAASGATPPLPSTPRAGLQRALAWIDHHFREPIRLADVAAVACLSPHYFSVLFRQATGVTFQDYLAGRRLQFARSLLAASDLPVTQVCHAAGFNDLTHFSRSFRRRFGRSPSTTRQTVS